MLIKVLYLCDCNQNIVIGCRMISTNRFSIVTPVTVALVRLWTVRVHEACHMQDGASWQIVSEEGRCNNSPLVALGMCLLMLCYTYTWKDDKMEEEGNKGREERKNGRD